MRSNKPALTTLLIACIYSISQVQGQIAPKIAKFSYSLALKGKFDRSTRTDNNPESLQRIYALRSLLPGINIEAHYQFCPRWAVSAGYGFEPYNKSWGIDNGGYLSQFRITSIYLSAHAFPIRLSYSGWHNKNLTIEPTGSLITNIAANNNLFDAIGSSSFWGNSVLNIYQDERPGLEYGIRKTFYTLDGNIQLRWKSNNRRAFFLGVGYTYGLQTIGRVTVMYFKPTIAPGQQFRITRDTYGSQVYLRIGFRFCAKNKQLPP